MPPCTAPSNAFVSRRYDAAARALCSETAIEAIWAPSILANATRFAPESTTATLSFQFRFAASAVAAAMTAFARSKEIGAP